MLDLFTFSIVAHDPAVGAFGVAVATARPAVGALVPFVSLSGGIATQARVNTDLGRRGIALLEQGVPCQGSSNFPWLGSSKIPQPSPVWWAMPGPR